MRRELSPFVIGLLLLLAAEKAKRDAELNRLQETLRKVNDVSDKLGKKLLAQEAFSAQSEALDFLRIKRYELTPRKRAAPTRISRRSGKTPIPTFPSSRKPKPITPSCKNPWRAHRATSSALQLQSLLRRMNFPE